jgi:DNA polymerase III delta subunit
MSNKQIKAIKFLAESKNESAKFFLYGNEHALCYKSRKHCLKNLDLQSLEKVYLNLDDGNFESLLDQSLMTNSLFNEKKVVFISMDKNRLNKDLIRKFKKIIGCESENLVIVEISNLVKKTIEKELINSFEGDAMFIDCFPPLESEIKNFLEFNLPDYLKKKENIQVFLELYEGNFSALLNDLEVLKILEIEDEETAMEVFSNNGNKNNYKLIEHISNQDVELALSIIDSMRTNDRNSAALLIWILSRDINAIKHLSEGKNIKTLGIWENQIQWYQKLSSRITPRALEKIVNEINIIDRKFKGVLSGDPWNGIKDVVLRLSA